MTDRLVALITAKWFKKALVLLFACILGGILLSQNAIFESLNQNWIDIHIRNNGLQGILLFVAIGAIATAVGSPRQLLAFLAGYAFGFVNGAILATLAAGIGCLISLFFARILARNYVQRRFPENIAGIDRFLKIKPFTKTIVIRLLPIGNNLVTNLAAGVTSVRATPFLLGSVLGYLPQMAIFALMGKGVIIMSIWKIVLSVALFVISSLLSIRLYKQYKAENLLDKEQTEQQNQARNKDIVIATK
ncbi:TVP38/TMEM64 family protein [Paraglaciecola sp. L3A3]|uniref:TVP38/TMEM64 family protein n=1 Tax=Paraglaciecola sp. L3A3 TaxID=2686358 RepID=UPI00131CAE08|nr:VTT domain-containing protein [Paraglaciecola sp. L3A3]